jgi:hypothetical protein
VGNIFFFDDGRMNLFSGDRSRRRLCGRHFDAVDPASNYISAHASFDDSFMGIDAALALFLGLYHAVDDDFFFTDVDLRLFLRCQSGADAHDFVVFQRALGFTPSHPQLVELGDKILGLDPQFLSQ